MKKQKEESKNRSIYTTERVAQIEDPQENEVDSKIPADKSPLDNANFSAVSRGF